MARQEQFLQGLLELAHLRDPNSRRAAWRSSVARVASSCEGDDPSPLEGLSPQKLLESVKVAVSSGLLDDLDWLSPAAAGTALYEIAAALPQGTEKREVGRRVSGRLFEGDASTFVAMAKRMAYGSGKGLSGEAVRCRVALVMATPVSLGVRSDELAFALLSRRELAREWVGANATGALADRRLSARLLEHAARAIARRTAQGDDSALRLLRSEAVAMAFDRLLRDREPLVWRHVAVARGIIAAYHQPFLEQMDHGLLPTNTPTEWRRAAASLAAFASARPDLCLRRLRDALARGFLSRDPGAASAFLWGAGAAADIEPEAAEEILELVVSEAPEESLEVMGDVLAFVGGGRFGERAVKLLQATLGRPSLHSNDASTVFRAAMRSQLLLELQPPSEREPRLQDLLTDAIRLYAEQGARAAYKSGLAILEQMGGSVDALEALDPDLGRDNDPPSNPIGGRLAGRAAYLLLRDLDRSLACENTLRDVLLLGHRLPEAQRALDQIDDLTDRTTGWLIEREKPLVGKGADAPADEARAQRLRALLHFADTRAFGEAEENDRAARARARCQRVVELALRLLAAGVPRVLQRTLCAALARALDGLLRDETLDPCDALFLVADRQLTVEQVDTLREASMSPDLGPIFDAYGLLLRNMLVAGMTDHEPASMSQSMAAIQDPVLVLGEAASLKTHEELNAASLADPVLFKRTQALSAFARSLDADASSRVEAMQSALQRQCRALIRILSSGSLAALLPRSENDMAPLALIERSVETMAQLMAGARQRFADRAGLALTPSAVLAAAVESAVQQGDRNAIEFALGSFREELAIALPTIFADVVNSSVSRLANLPVTSATDSGNSSKEVEVPLPAWMPRRRILGGFYVVRSLGSGAGGTVFVARRIEDRNDLNAERFALKVPDYDGTAARSLSEYEFLQLFRAEASALLELPHHPNLARFVTFDLATRPKPILVMELVEGVSLERLIQSRKLSSQRLFAVLEGVLAGLDAMHKKGVGHLDIKPSNVILRESTGDPVLVDFGLSGRNLRPGCGTVYYGAPEVWGLIPDGVTPTPAPVDIYAVACLVYEMLTGRVLFDAPTEMAVIAAHLGHDGWPAPLVALAENPDLRPLVTLLSAALRRDPRERITIPNFRKRIGTINTGLAQTVKG